MATGPETIGSAVPSPPWGEGGAKRRVRGQKPAPSSLGRARSLRRNETEAEKRLWNLLRNRSIAGLKFVRQHPVGPFFADFVCREHMLVVEVDGSQHADAASDVARTAFLNARGYAVLRFWNNEVLAELDGVAAMLVAAVDGSLTSPSPGQRYAPATLSPEGQGSKGASAATTRQRSYRLTVDLPRLNKE